MNECECLLSCVSVVLKGSEMRRLIGSDQGYRSTTLVAMFTYYYFSTSSGVSWSDLKVKIRKRLRVVWLLEGHQAPSRRIAQIFVSSKRQELSM